MGNRNYRVLPSRKKPELSVSEKFSRLKILEHLRIHFHFNSNNSNNVRVRLFYRNLIRILNFVLRRNNKISMKNWTKQCTSYFAISYRWAISANNERVVSPKEIHIVFRSFRWPQFEFSETHRNGEESCGYVDIVPKHEHVVPLANRQGDGSRKERILINIVAA